MDQLPEFRVALTRLKPGEQAYPQGENVPSRKTRGQRTKLGGEPDWVQGSGQVPKCPGCKKPMTFVAQIDSVEHQSSSNPHSVSALSDDQKWMFGDVGMIYVFFCSSCLTAYAEFEGG